ncbi:GrpB family protein [Hymenobacter nivis]|uniref:GrpB family protein n=1 Tax=Hymenobacter nivis TaxID=1850093 RepID=A0A502H1U8_9BACT|nr:GrpB family protein [Hymenobacter nivis]TPG67350.1 GrpB family protein [Hymenobacter nivis]
MKKLIDLTKEEIGQLFPVEITPYDALWAVLFAAERRRILAALGPDVALRIEHFGSTSVPGLPAKDTIDILVEIPPGPEGQEQLIARMQGLGYDFMWQTDGAPPYLVFVKGYDPAAPKAQTYHVHMGPQGHALWDRLYFRDHLRQHPAVAEQYAQLKYALAEEHRHERVAYRVAKTDFVARVTAEAKAHFGAPARPDLPASAGAEK